MPGSFLEVEIHGDQVLFDELVGLLSANAYEGFWEEGSNLRCFIRAARWDDQQARELETAAVSLARHHNVDIPRISVRPVEDQNWNAEWEASIQPIQISEHIVVAPTWHPYTPAPGQLVITIDPKMSFGTGHHETTRLMMQLIEKHVRPGMTLLDVGTGTGILAIAAIRLGAASATGVDNDEWSFDNARENAALNGVADRFTVMLGEIGTVPAGTFDVVAANIQRNVIEQILPSMMGRLAQGGKILLSGLLQADGEAIRAALMHQGLRITAELHEQEWIAFAAERA